MTQVMDKVKELSESQLKVVSHFIAFLIEVEGKQGLKMKRHPEGTKKRKDDGWGWRQ